jgi:DNA mismatch endonuclease (patch repair protein)
LFSQTFLQAQRRGKLPDVVDRKTRSRMMSGIRSRNTGPERLIRSELHRHGFRFRLHSKKAPGHPDIVLPKYRVAIHVHGCFWHGHDCALFRQPATRAVFWRRKLDRNRRRDLAVLEETLAAGWRHLTIWECAFRGRGQLGLMETGARLSAWIKGRRKTGMIRSNRA